MEDFLPTTPILKARLATYWCATTYKTYEPMEDVAVE